MSDGLIWSTGQLPKSGKICFSPDSRLRSSRCCVLLKLRISSAITPKRTIAVRKFSGYRHARANPCPAFLTARESIALATNSLAPQYVVGALASTPNTTACLTLPLSYCLGSDLLGMAFALPRMIGESITSRSWTAGFRVQPRPQIS